MKLEELFCLNGKVALVTGGGRGIGKFIATGLAEAGANIILASRNLNNLEDTARELESAFGIQALPLSCDLNVPEQIDAMLNAAVEKFGRIDILINNSGLVWPGPTLAFPLKGWDMTFNINVRGVWILTQKIANLMKNQGGGTIVNISSILGSRGTQEEAQPAVAYNSTKAAINVLTMNLAVKLAPYNIRVNAIAPGYFRTDMMAYIDQPEYKAIKELTMSYIPMARGGDADDIKGVAVFLASDASAFITGAILPVDGGQLAH